MDRQQIQQLLKDNTHDTVLLELPTGYGKTRLSLLWAAQQNPKNILVVIPRVVLVNNWKDEIAKANINGYDITFTTYNSLKKFKDGNFDVIIIDEAHHITDKTIDALKSIQFNKAILLSATINHQKREIINLFFKDISTVKIDMSDAIESGVLPDPRIILIPIALDNTQNTEVFIKKGNNNVIDVTYAERWRKTTSTLRVHCNQRQMYFEMSSVINWLKERSRNPRIEQTWLRKCKDRLVWLASKKEIFTKNILRSLSNYRTITFCSNIEQTNILGKNAIHSKNKTNQDTLSKFNSKKIKHITACDMLNEGVNLTDCRIGIFNYLNSSSRIQIQKLGRILRHPSPIIIIPYFTNTREEEIVKEMVKDYNKDLIEIINYDNINELKLI